MRVRTHGMGRRATVSRLLDRHNRSHLALAGVPGSGRPDEVADGLVVGDAAGFSAAGEQAITKPVIAASAPITRGRDMGVMLSWRVALQTQAAC